MYLFHVGTLLCSENCHNSFEFQNCFMQDWDFLLEICANWQYSPKILWQLECHLLGVLLLIASRWLMSQYQAGCDMLF